MRGAGTVLSGSATFTECGGASYSEVRKEALPAIPDIVITVCGNAAGETCPAYLGPVLRAHWGVDDPAQVSGSEAEINAAFQHAYQVLRARIEALLALPLATLSHDRTSLKAALERIGQCVPG